MTREEAWLLNEKYGGEPNDEFVRDCERLRMGEPLAYVIGWVPFHGAKIWLDSHPLIPRPETEHWVGEAMREMKHRDSLNVLDLCAGSGCIGIAVAKNVPGVRTDFAELDVSHHPTIKKNLGENGLGYSRICGGDLFACVEGPYDYILANPPYIDPLHDRTDESVREHEPELALYGGPGGLEFIERILAQSRAFLSPRGILFLEHEPEQAEAVRDLGREQGFTSEAHEDQYGVRRYTRLTVAEGT